jgi:hypothetical protein
MFIAEVRMLTILAYTSSSYAPRTYANAAKGDVTIAIAVDYNTAGERLTHKAAGDKYFKLDPSNTEIENARLLYTRLKKLGKELPVINVAGNGIYTLGKYGETQDRINLYVLILLAKVHEHWPIGEIVSGGQTGVDIAGGVAGYVLGIPTTMLLPKGFKQRFEDGIDIVQTEQDVRNQVECWAEKLPKNSENGVAQPS